MSKEIWTSRNAAALRGTVRAPGDKSISHRALILGGLADGETRIEGLLESADVLATAAAVRAFGAEVTRLADGRWRVAGNGAFRQPAGPIDCGNSGTAARLLMGAAAGFPIAAEFRGDASLSARPMKRVTAPLTMMGTRIDDGGRGTLPLTVRGGGLSGLRYVLPVPSAQVKSAILLAGLRARGEVRVIERERTRDHSERMLRAFGADVAEDSHAEGHAVTLGHNRRLYGQAVRVPGDPSSAAFPIAAALIVPGSEVVVENVALNPLRTGLFQTLIEMGADLAIEPVGETAGEPVGRVRARYSRLRGVSVPAGRAPSMIDEYPVLAAIAAFAEGETRMEGVGELRVKESDRIALMLAGLARCGVTATAGEDWFAVEGTGRPPAGAATLDTEGDHRIAMSFLVLGLATAAPVAVREPAMIATSFPDFGPLMGALGAQIGGETGAA